MGIAELLPFLKEGGLLAVCAVLGSAYWNEKSKHDKTKEAERTRLLEELNYLNRVRDGGS